MRCIPRARLHSTLVFAAALAVPLHAAPGQTAARARWEVTGLPALNYDADEGLGYGAVVELYDYAPRARPYRLTIQPTLFLTTQGRRDATIFVDAPSLGGGRWRVTAFGGREHQLAAPFYGVGNGTPYDAALERAPNPYFYRYGRDQLRLTTDVQRRVAASPLRILAGAGVTRTALDATPFDSGTTLLAAQLGAALPIARGNYARVGLVWDTRDREIGPTRGVWAEAIVQRATRALGATSDFTRTTATVRGYHGIGPRLVLAERVAAQTVTGDAPFFELTTIESSYKRLEGLGGAQTLRGVPRDRWIGPALWLSNSELRWHVRDGRLLGRATSTTLTAFADAGRVWDRVPNAGEAMRQALRDVHGSFGAGARLGFGESFVAALDVGHSSQAAAQLYIGLGYLF